MRIVPPPHTEVDVLAFRKAFAEKRIGEIEARPRKTQGDRALLGAWREEREQLDRRLRAMALGRAARRRR